MALMSLLQSYEATVNEALSASRVLQSAWRPRGSQGSSRGFSLVELLVVTGIFVIITGIILANNSLFGSIVVLENLTYDVALSVRHAQLYGIAVRRFGSSDYNVGYGIHFGDATSYQLFADSLQGNGIYDCPNESLCELVESTTIAGGHRISDLCVRGSGSSTYSCGKSSIDILFKRPEPDAYILASTGGIQDGVSYDAAQIVLSSPRGQTKRVDIERSGQIAVQ